MVPLLHLSKVGRRVGRAGGILTVNIQDKGGKEFVKGYEQKATPQFQDKPKRVSTVGLARSQASLFSVAFLEAGVACSPPPHRQ